MIAPIGFKLNYIQENRLILTQGEVNYIYEFLSKPAMWVKN